MRVMRAGCTVPCANPLSWDFAKEGRLETLLNLSFRLDSPRGCIEVLEQLEPAYTVEAQTARS